MSDEHHLTDEQLQERHELASTISNILVNHSRLIGLEALAGVVMIILRDVRREGHESGLKSPKEIDKSIVSLIDDFCTSLKKQILS